MRHAPFSSIWRYDGISSQSVLLVRFVKSLHDRFGLALHHAQGLENTAAGVRRNPSHPLGGMVLLQRFCNKLRLRWLIQNHIKVPQRHADYLPSDLILALLYAIMAGCDASTRPRFCRTTEPSSPCSVSPAFPIKLPCADSSSGSPPGHPPTGRPARPTSSSIVPFTQTANHPHLRSRFGSTDRLWETAICSCRLQPKKRGRRSYHPLICFEAHLQEFWHGSLRPGNTVTATGLVAFVKRCFEKVPSSIAWSRVRVRGVPDASGSGWWNSSIHAGVATPWWPRSTPPSKPAPAVVDFGR